MPPPTALGLILAVRRFACTTNWLASCLESCASPEINRVVPHRKPRLGEFTSSVDNASQDVVSSDEDASLLGVASGTGILEFSPVKAGMDVTPANLEFPIINASSSGNRKASPPPVLAALESESF